VYNKWDVSSYSQDKLEVAGTFPFIVRNGIELYYAFGDCTTTGPVSGVYTHPITGLNAGNLPSRVFHVENTGGETDFYYDVVGCKTQALNLGFVTGTQPTPLTARLSYLGCKIIDSVANTNPAVTQTSVPPALPVQTNKFPFTVPATSYITWDDTDVAEFISWNYIMSNALIPRWTNPVGLDEYLKNERRWAQYIHEMGKRRHIMTMVVYQKNQSIWNSMMDQLKKTFVMKFSRDSTNDDDYIKITANNTHPQAYEIKKPTAGDIAIYAITLYPTTVTVEVKDDLSIAYYEVA